ncbi:MAG TPA: DUF2244 domain-containing protein [Gammaproteobacteria bacterium]|nr:DUF2244 domain-containing protein [Gammaproteobacteria bacterium]
MVDGQLDRHTGTGSLLLVPNRSWSWDRNRRFLVLTSALVMGLPGTLALMFGWWPMLPVAGLELAVLWWVTYRLMLRLQFREVVSLTDTEVIVQAGRRGPEQEVHLPRVWTRLVVRPGPSHWYLKRLYLRYAGRETELARYLNAEDKDRVERELRRAL